MIRKMENEAKLKPGFSMKNSPKLTKSHQGKSIAGLLGIEPRFGAPEAPVISSTPQTYIVKSSGQLTAS